MKKRLLIRKNSGKTVKPILFDKIKLNEKITLVEDNKIFNQDVKVAEELKERSFLMQGTRSEGNYPGYENCSSWDLGV